MAYAVGKLNTGLFFIYQSLNDTLKRFSNTSLQEPLFAVFKQDLEEARESLSKEASLVEQQVDPFLLRNQVAIFDESSQSIQLQTNLERSIRLQFLYQFSVFASGLVLTHFGVPWLYTIPSAVSLSVIGLVWSNLKWKVNKNQFLAQVSAAQQVLRERLQVIDGDLDHL